MSTLKSKQKKTMNRNTKIGIGVGIGVAALVVVLVITLTPGVASIVIGTEQPKQFETKITLDLPDDDFESLCTNIWQPSSFYKWFRLDDAVPTNQLNDTYAKFVKAVSPSTGRIFAPMSKQFFLIMNALRTYANVSISPNDMQKGIVIFLKNGNYTQFSYLINVPSQNVQSEEFTKADSVVFQPKGVPFAYMVSALTFDMNATIASGLFGISYTIQ